MQVINQTVNLSGNQTVAGTKTWASAIFSATLQQAAGSTEQLVAVPVTITSTIAGQANTTANATSGNITLTLPVAAGTAHARMVITKTDATANTVTIAPQVGGTIGGAANYVLTAQFQSVTLLNINSAVAGAWVIVGKT